MTNITGVIKSIQDIMRKDVGVSGDAQRIEQMVWLIFLKIFDDRESELELIEDHFDSPVPEHLRWRNWAANPEGITGEALMDFINLQLFPKLKNELVLKGEQGERAQIICNVFTDANNFMKSGTLLRQVINKINEVNFNNSEDRHTFGDIYEKILKDLQSAGNAGEFYTPRAITRLIIERLNPQLDEIVFDPACGTGGFLSCAIDHKLQFVKTSGDRESLARTIRGVEKKPLPFNLCITNMILHGIDTPTRISRDNTLAKPFASYSDKDRVHVIATNPPFGGMEEDGIENNFPSQYRTRETADLFMALIIRLLRVNGRAGVVLPDGFLFGEGTKKNIKQELLETCNLHTIVRLPGGVFNPYTGIKTNILFFTKGQPTKDIWFWEQPYPEGVVNYNKGRPMQFEEFDALRAWWGDEDTKFRSRKKNQNAWKVTAEHVAVRGYNLDEKNPHIVETEIHDPEKLLAAYADSQREVQALRNQLKVILSEALGRKS